MTKHRVRSALLALITAGLIGCGPAAPPAAPTSPPAPAAQPTTAPAAAAKPTTAPAAAAQPTTAPAAKPAAPAAPAAAAAMPADAADANQQVFVKPYDNTADFTTLDFYESVYKRGDANADLFSEPLVRLNKNFEVVPGAALEWSGDSTGKVWTFKLDPNLMWSDDTPLTADDYVATFRYGADPKHAWDFAWFFNGVIVNWEEAVAGKAALDSVGVKAVDKNTFQVTTVEPAPYLPTMMLYSMVMQKKALETVGGLYNSNPATAVSAGPYVLTEWRKGDRVIMTANPKYKGKNKPLIQKVVNIGMAPNAMFAAYQAKEIDFVAGNFLSPADNDIIAADPALSKELHPHYGDFRTDYLFFDTKAAPFDNLKVRQAFSHVIPRDDLIKQIIKPSQGIPAFSFLMPGFPAANSEGLKSIQSYDPAAGKALLAEAGFPNGQGFPKLTLWLRNEAPVRQAAAQAIAASIKQNLGIEVDVSNKETKTFMDALNSKPTQVQFGMVSYGFDFLDPYNMLSVWLSGGRHNWNNVEFDNQVKKAAAFTGDSATRINMFQDAERLLVTESAGVFIYHRTIADLYRPYLKGSELEADKNGFAALHWPGFTNTSASVGTVYISKDASSAGRKLP
jgi:peptide/nickel transport system substrate-binding protein/oligopeptide transport system substrate-binding protein